MIDVPENVFMHFNDASEIEQIEAAILLSVEAKLAIDSR